jgi:hypothetical protein
VKFTNDVQAALATALGQPLGLFPNLGMLVDWEDNFLEWVRRWCIFEFAGGMATGFEETEDDDKDGDRDGCIIWLLAELT